MKFVLGKQNWFNTRIYPPAVKETWVQSLGWEDTLEKEVATHSTILAGEFHGLYSPLGHKESYTTERLSLTVYQPYQ